MSFHQLNKKVNYLKTKKTKIMETKKEQVEISTENINKAFESIKAYSSSKDYKITGQLTIGNFIANYPSNRAMKKFRNSLKRVISHPTMKSANLFLHHLAKYSDCSAKLEYSDKEKAIIEKRNKWKEAKALAAKLQMEYKEEKGDYYKTFKQF